jgi:O-methyltransferase
VAFLGAFLHSIRTGQPSVDAVYGISLWQYLDDVDPATGAVFDAAMTAGSSRLTPAILAAYDFSGLSTLVDVGGGHGHLLAAVLQANPRLRGVLFDRPSTVAALHDDLGAPGVAERVEVVAGSFFDGVPMGADAYLLKLVLHDWDDESAGQILGRLREAVPAHGRMLVVERVLSRTTDLPAAALVDLEMLKNHAGRERTEDEFRALPFRRRVRADPRRAGRIPLHPGRADRLTIPCRVGDSFAPGGEGTGRVCEDGGSSRQCRRSLSDGAVPAGPS